MRLLACLVLTTLLASAFAQEGSSVPSKSSVIHLYPSPYKQLSRSAIQDYRAQIEAVNALPNVEVQMMNDGGMFTAGDSAMETEATDSAVDPSSVIVDYVSDVVAASMSQDAEPVAAATQAPMIAMKDVEPTLVVEPEPEPAPEDTSKDEKFVVPEPEPVDPIEIAVIEVEKPRQPTKEELKEVDKYNDAVDNIVNILNKRLTQKDALPLELDEEVLERLEEEVTTLPPPVVTTLPPPPTPATITEGSTAASVCPDRLVTKCATEKCKKKQKCQDKCERKGCLKKKKNKKNKKRKGDDKNKKNKKNQNNNKNNKNKNNKNKKKNQNKQIRNKLFRPRVNSGNDYSRRQSKDLDLDEVEQARRKGDDNNVSKNKKPGNKGNKKRDNNRNKNNKKKNKNRSDLKAEAKDAYVPKSAEEGPLFSNNEELFSAPAVFMGFSQIRRQGDVQVDLSGKWPTFITTVVMGPVNVLLTDPTALLKRSEVTTELTAKMHFTAKQARKRTKLKINEVTVEVPQDENISVLRSDLDLDLDVISAAQNEVSSAIDTDRIARIIHHELEAVFDEDNILQNLEDHPSLKP